MKTNIIKKVTAVSLTLGMVASAIALPLVNAEEAPKHVEITKVITKDSNVYLPKATFTFEIKPGQKVDGTAGNYAVYAGIEGAVTLNKNTIESAPADDATLTQKKVVLNDKITVQIDESKFKVGGQVQPGIYRYVITEKAGNGITGITYDSTQKYFDVYVDNAGKVYSHAFVTTTDTKVKSDGQFTNNYGKKENGDDTDDNKLYQLTVTKKVTGIQGDTNKKFKFNIKIDGEAGEKYYLEVNNQKVAALESGKQATFDLANGQNAVIKGIDGDDKVTLNENSYAADGYKTTAKFNTQDHDVSFTNQVLDKNSTVEYTNDKSVNTPTGIVMTFAPYVLLVLGAGVFFVMFKKNRDVEEI